MRRTASHLVLTVAVAISVLPGCGTPSCQPHFPNAVLVIYGDKGDAHTSATLFSKGQSVSAGTSGKHAVNLSATYRDEKFACRYHWDVLPSSNQADRFRIRVAVTNGPTLEKEITFVGDPVIVFEHVGYCMKVEVPSDQ